MILHVGKGHIIALKKGKAGIIILKIKRIPHTRGHLVNKTENTLIGTGLVVAHQTVFKGNAQILVIVFHLQLPLLSIRLLHKKRQRGAVYIIFIIKNIFDLVSVDRQESVPRLKLQCIGYGAGIYGLDRMAFFIHICLSSPFS